MLSQLRRRFLLRPTRSWTHLAGAFFNPLAGREPGHALIDSDLDWGQDFFLLERELRARRISSVHYGFFGP